MRYLRYPFGEGTPLGTHENDQVWHWHLRLQIPRELLEAFKLLIVEEARLSMHATENVSIFVNASIED